MADCVAVEDLFVVLWPATVVVALLICQLSMHVATPAKQRARAARKLAEAG